MSELGWTHAGARVLVTAALVLIGPRTVICAPDDQVAVTPEIVLVRGDGTTEAIPVSAVQWPLDADGRDVRGSATTFAVGPRVEAVVFATEDLRAAARRVRVRVPRPLTPTLSIRIPTADHPSLREVALEVVDPTTNAPVLGATLEWDEMAANPATQSADEKGLIRIASAGRVSGFERLMRSKAILHAPGRRALGIGGRAVKDGDVPDADEFERRLALRPTRVELVARERAESLEERTILLADAGGAPVVGALVWIGSPVCTKDPMSGLFHLADGGDGFRRSGADGSVRFPMLGTVGIEVRLRDVSSLYGGVPIASYALDLALCPMDVPRALRLPAIADLELTLDGVPDGVTLVGSTDRWGLARTPLDGTVAPVMFDPGIEARWKERCDAVIPAFEFDARTELRATSPVYRRPILVGRATTIYLEPAPWTPEAAAEEPRSIIVTPARAGRLALIRRWADLPIGR